jgi:signal transduction histidine kinase
MWLRSLRARFLIGSILWTLGLLGASHILFVAILPYLGRHLFVIRHWTLMALIALAFMIGGLSQVRRGLSPINQLRRRLAELRDGEVPRLEGTYPTEVQPLVDDLNTLLAHQQRAVNRAQAKAGDLAHGLKTPLAVLAQEADRARAGGHADVASAIDQQVARMQRQVDYHLAHARAAASGAAPGARCAIGESVDGLLRALRRLHADRSLHIDVAVPGDHAVAAERPDLDEMLGNLLDNACKWTAARVAVASTIDGDSVVVHVDDDGPGLDPSMRLTVLQRGVRADETAPGSGLGLAIVRDLAELYGGSVALTDSPLGGLRAALRLPRIRAAASLEASRAQASRAARPR